MYVHWRHEELQTVTSQMNKIKVGVLWSEDDVYKLRSTGHEILEWTKITTPSKYQESLGQ